VAESGFPAYEVTYWYGIFTGAAVPREILTQLHNEVAQALRAPDVVSGLNKQGATPGAMTQPQFADFVKAEHARWGKVARSTGIRLD
jgi:tripartite-type tricarboxylate transporter receptor subunit TctC